MQPCCNATAHANIIITIVVITWTNEWRGSCPPVFCLVCSSTSKSIANWNLQCIVGFSVDVQCAVFITMKYSEIQLSTVQWRAEWTGYWYLIKISLGVLFCWPSTKSENVTRKLEKSKRKVKVVTIPVLSEKQSNYNIRWKTSCCT